MDFQLMFPIFWDIVIFGSLYGLVLAGVMRKMISLNQMADPLLRFADFSAKVVGGVLVAFAINGIAWGNNWFNYHANVNLFRATSYTFLVISIAIFVVGVQRISWTDRLLIAVVFGGILLMEGLFYPVHYLIKVAAMLTVIAIRVVWLLIRSRKVL